jgi:hypothetical protein
MSSTAISWPVGTRERVRGDEIGPEPEHSSPSAQEVIVCRGTWKLSCAIPVPSSSSPTRELHTQRESRLAAWPSDLSRRQIDLDPNPE